ncbi:MAG: outer membrane protein assembly factor BamA [Pseudomonadota bacterium]
MRIFGRHKRRESGRAGSLQALLLALLLALGATPALIPAPAAAQTVTIQGIDVAGNRRIEAETIRIYSGLAPGETVGAVELNNALRRIFATGLFSSVEVLPAPGGRILIEVAENPTINRINFEGNDVLDDERLQQVIRLRPRLAYTRSAAEADAAIILEGYRATGRYSAEVTPVIIRQPDNRVDLVFEIFEGPVTEVSSISFVGNETYSDRRLRSAIETSEATLLSFFFFNDTYDPDRIELDKQLLRQFYLERGYADVTVQSSVAELARERDGFFLTFQIEEGEVYTFGGVDVVSNTPGLDPELFFGVIDHEEGDRYNVAEVERTIDRMVFEAGVQGFAFIEVRPRVRRDAENRTISITYELLEGPRVFVERIDIVGNTATLDRVIRREFDFVEGDAFNARAVQRATDNIRGLNYFDSVNVDVSEGSGPDRAVVTVEVDEALTGSLSFGVGFSSSDGPVGSLELSERNFLGRGQTVNVAFTVSGDDRLFRIGFIEPRLLDRDLSAGFQFYFEDQDRDESSFELTRLGFEPNVGFPLSEDSRLSLRYRVSSDEIRNVPDTASFVIQSDEGTEITSSIGYTYTLDQRNSPVEPTAGYLVSLSQDFAGLGGDQRYVRTVARARGFQSFFGEDVILSAEVEGGALITFGNDARVTDRFFLGGATFRGFTFGEIGPRDFNNSVTPGVNDALGGNFYAVARFQASFPLGLPEEYGVFGGVFSDVGTLWGLDQDTFTVPGEGTFTIDDSPKLRASVGISLFWDSPFAPLRFDIAVPVVSQDGDDEEIFRFSAGTRF